MGHDTRLEQHRTPELNQSNPDSLFGDVPVLDPRNLPERIEKVSGFHVIAEEMLQKKKKKKKMTQLPGRPNFFCKQMTGWCTRVGKSSVTITFFIR